MQKRGQVTIFIIIGIVILAVFALIFFFRGQIIESDFQTELTKVKVPEQLKPVKFYIDDCVEDTIYKGAIILGNNGGYINPPKEKIPRSVVNPFSNSLQIGNSEVSYWYYKSANNIDKTQVPTIGSMETDLEIYLNNEFNFCIRGLDFYLDEGFEIEQSLDINSNVNIEDTHIEVTVFSPTDIRLGDVGQYYDKHLVDVPVNLGKLYKLALEVFEKENEDRFLEEKTIDMMVVYDEIPFSNTEFECDILRWQKSEVEDNFKKIVERNLGAIRLENSDFTKTTEDNDYFEIDLKTDNDITATFEYYKDWPFFMEVSPTKGDILIGDPITQSNPDISKYLNLFFCLNNYHFVYDIKYPALISLSDNSGYNFQLASMVVIDKNTPRQFEGEIINYDNPGSLGDEYCDNRFNSIDVIAFDASNLFGVSNVDISYSCITSNCYIGKTNSQGNLITEFPICVNGKLYADKQGYYSNPEVLSTDVDSKVNVLLEPYSNLDVETKAVDLNTGRIRNLLNDEEAVFQLENLDNGFVTNVVSDINNVDLVSGRYSVTAYLMKTADNPITIQGKTYVECADIPRPGVLGILGFDKEECFETRIDDTEINSFISGAVEFEFTLTHSQLRSGNKITLYAAHDKQPKTTQDMLDIIGNVGINKNNNNFVYPVVE